MHIFIYIYVDKGEQGNVNVNASKIELSKGDPHGAAVYVIDWVQRIFKWQSYYDMSRGENARFSFSLTNQHPVFYGNAIFIIWYFQFIDM